MSSPQPHRQNELLVFLRAHVKAHGIAPTLSEMAAFLGIKSRGSCMRMLDRLVERGLIRRAYAVKRGIELVYTEDYHAPDCNCAKCARGRYLAQLKAFKGLEADPPFRVVRARMDNIRLLDPATRAELTGIPDNAAPRTRTALPREAS